MELGVGERRPTPEGAVCRLTSLCPTEVAKTDEGSAGHRTSLLRQAHKSGGERGQHLKKHAAASRSRVGDDGDPAQSIKKEQNTQRRP